MHNTTHPSPAALADAHDVNRAFSTHLGFAEYHGKLHLYDGNFEETARGSKDEVIAYLRSLLSLIPADEESLSWRGSNGQWYAGDEARAAIRGEMLEPHRDQPDDALADAQPVPAGLNADATKLVGARIAQLERELAECREAMHVFCHKYSVGIIGTELDECYHAMRAILAKGGK